MAVGVLRVRRGTLSYRRALCVTNIPITVIVGLFGLIGGVSAASVVTAIARRKVTAAESESMIVTSAGTLMDRQQAQMDHGDKERDRMEVLIGTLRLEVDGLRRELREERIRCDIELHAMRVELRAMQAQMSANHPQQAISRLPTQINVQLNQPTEGETL